MPSAYRVLTPDCQNSIVTTVGGILWITPQVPYSFNQTDSRRLFRVASAYLAKPPRDVSRDTIPTPAD